MPILLTLLLLDLAAIALLLPLQPRKRPEKLIYSSHTYRKG